MILTSVSFLKLLWFASTSYIPLLFLQKAEIIRITNNKNTVIYHWQEKLTMHVFQEGSRKSWTDREKKASFIVFLAESHQWAKKAVSNSPGLVDFATGLVNSVLNLPDGQEKFFGEFTVINPAHQEKFFRAKAVYKVTLGLVHSSYSLPEWQAAKLTFFEPCTFFNAKNIISLIIITEIMPCFAPVKT